MVKIGFVGAGRIGSTSAYAVLHRVDCDEIVLVDIIEDTAIGESLDLSTAAIAMGKDAIVTGGRDYSSLRNSDVIVISAGLARKPGMTRLDLTKANAAILSNVMEQLNFFAGAILVLATNPVDLMTYMAFKLSQKPRSEVIGMGSSHDTARLREQILGYGVRSNAMMIGEHGDSMTLLKKGDADGINWDGLTKATKERAMEVIKRKGATYYAPASCVAEIVKAIINDEGALIPVSVFLEGEYGLHDVAIGVPAIIGKHGAEVVEYDLDEEGLTKLRDSANIIKKMLKDVSN
ncbi:MAG: malate dehydrogenase [Methanocellales archaeon]|nr:malate dehydrogenase [Methanocellales archaeon]MDD3421731.1 malate dehydrogenase [Methanocellales archaeon]MDD4898752.1 malate dehydrogenase [Methanocellales archaeon]MDD5447435.1 malate dehydrogenase [Methanocellales archaeon]